MALLSHTEGQNDSPNSPVWAGFVRSFLSREYGRFGFIRTITRFDLSVLCVMVGIALYYAGSFEPFVGVQAVFAIACAIGTIVLYRSIVAPS